MQKKKKELNYFKELERELKEDIVSMNDFGLSKEYLNGTKKVSELSDEEKRYIEMRDDFYKCKR